MSNYPFMQLDVFTGVALKGNPLAVVFDADILSESQMRAFANWTNLSETTFLLKPTDPTADYRVRIFTPTTEFKFAGHPTLGSCHAWLTHGGVPKVAGRVVQECGVGLVNVHQLPDGLAFEAPPLRASAIAPEQFEEVCKALGLHAAQVRASQQLDNGNQWLGLLLDSAKTVLALEPDHAALALLPKVGVIGLKSDGADHFEVRAFATCNGIPEDPVTGALNAMLAQWLIAAGFAPERYRVTQGTRLGRAGQVNLERRPSGGAVWVGGQSVVCIQGKLTL